ncbi:hypothetical protein NL108_002226 [Boleophthalmus pectinirostris]|nr:hypothetical protein NL108_002226 [Boleophthalmus pectinirostris]
MEYRRPLGQDHALVSSWLQEGPLIKDAQYRCVAKTSTGNDKSEVNLQLPFGDEDSIPSKYLNKWKSALVEHGRLLKKWEKAWQEGDMLEGTALRNLQQSRVRAEAAYE